MDAVKISQVAPFLRVVDMKAALGFYVEGLGFEIVDRWDDRGVLRWCSISLGGATLMLQQFRAKGQDAWVPDGRVGEGVTLILLCDDAVAAWRTAEANGLDPDRPEVGNGMWVVGLDDPDGYHLEFQSPTDTPEDTVYKGD